MGFCDGGGLARGAGGSFRIFALPDVAKGREGVDEALDGRGADAGEVAGKGLRAVGLLPSSLMDHAAHEGDLVGEGGLNCF